MFTDQPQHVNHWQLDQAQPDDTDRPAGQNSLRNMKKGYNMSTFTSDWVTLVILLYVRNLKVMVSKVASGNWNNLTFELSAWAQCLVVIPINSWVSLLSTFTQETMGQPEGSHFPYCVWTPEDLKELLVASSQSGAEWGDKSKLNLV